MSETADIFDADFMRELETLRALLLRLRASQGDALAGRGRNAGQSEFRGHRPYVMGDDLRRLDWNAYGRLGKFFLREFDPERSESASLLVDTSASMQVGTPRKLDAALRIAAAFGFLALQQGAAIRVQGRPEIQGASRFTQVLDQLCDIANTPTTLGEIVGQTSGSRTRDLFVVTDGMEPIETLAPLQAASTKGSRVTLVFVLDDSELNPSPIGAVQLNAMEGGERRMILDSSTVAEYMRLLETHLDRVRDIANRHKWTFAVCDSTMDLGELFTGQLRSIVQ